MRALVGAGDRDAGLTPFDGEPWETEDQRAWTDASFKSYSPPIDWPHPVELAAGTVVRHVVRLDVTTTAEADPRARRRASRSHG
jgi:hypothetical protein